jgi:DDE superfamily endonuclease
MRQWIVTRADWLLVYRLPPYAPDLNPAEGIWSNLRITLLNVAVRGIDELTALIKHRLKRMQYQPELLTGFIAQTGLMISDPMQPGAFSLSTAEKYSNRVTQCLTPTSTTTRPSRARAFPRRDRLPFASRKSGVRIS